MKKLIQVLIVCGLFVVMGGTASGETQQEIIDKMCSKESYPIEKNMIKVKGFYIGMSICDAGKVMTEGKYKNFFKHLIFIETQQNDTWSKYEFPAGIKDPKYLILTCIHPYNRAIVGYPGVRRFQRPGVTESKRPGGKFDRGQSISCGKTKEADKNEKTHMNRVSKVIADNDGKVLYIELYNGNPYRTHSFLKHLFKSEQMSFDKFIEVFTKAYIKGQGLLGLTEWEHKSNKDSRTVTTYNELVGYKLSITKGTSLLKDKITMSRVAKSSEGFGD
jgi:hypothetical protein